MWGLIFISIMLIAFFLYYREKKKGEKSKMPSGVQIWDKNGNLQLDYTDSLCRLYGSFRINGRSGSKTVDIPQDDTGELFAIVIVDPIWYRWSIIQYYVCPSCSIEISGRTINWLMSYSTASQNIGSWDEVTGTVYYGTW